ncbi:uncharacterized protein [Branchiostoma lanceolatum]|uniref:uncharacterized protein isoform X1 n=1 Tax=Branchiostoma lanceolatum TaxID=7740 RepID=UPI003455DD9C
MRISRQMLRSRAGTSPKLAEWLDLSDLGIVLLEKLNMCPRLQALHLRGNHIETVQGLEACANIWYLDLSNNGVRFLDGLSRFVAIGTLILSNNDLTWEEVGKLRQLHILELCLHGNAQLEKDTYYRIHVIDCLPHVWMLDGRLVTSAERLQVTQFFQDSALTDHPVRHKLSTGFTPTVFKSLELYGIFGEKTTHLRSRFPLTDTMNIDLDRRRLKYLAFNVQEDLLLEREYSRRTLDVPICPTFLEDLIDMRQHDRERCNMLLLLFVASLEFSIPAYLMKETLEVAKLDYLGVLETMSMFLLPRDVRCRVVSILLSAVKMDRDSKEEGGLYDKLYLCLYYTVSELIRRGQLDGVRQRRGSGLTTDSRQGRRKGTLYKEYRCLLASEVVQLFCIVPAFYEFIDKDPGVRTMLCIATADDDICARIGEIIDKIRSDQVGWRESLQLQGDVRRMFEETSEYILHRIQTNSRNIDVINAKIPPKSQEHYILNTQRALPKRPQSSPIYASTQLFKGKRTETPTRQKPRVMSSRSPRSLSGAKPVIHIGDQVLLGPQNTARVIALPEQDIALVQMDAIPAANGSIVIQLDDLEQHYCYIDTHDLVWDHLTSVWKPVGTKGDRITIHNVDSDPSKAKVPPLGTAPSPVGGGSPLHASLTNLSMGSPASPQGSDSSGRESTTSLKTPTMPRAMSLILRDKLDLKLDVSEEVLKTTVFMRSLSQDDMAKSEGSDPPLVPSVESTENVEAVLYDCIKNAVETLPRFSRAETPEGAQQDSPEQRVVTTVIPEEPEDAQEENQGGEEDQGGLEAAKEAQTSEGGLETEEGGEAQAEGGEEQAEGVEEKPEGEENEKTLEKDDTTGEVTGDGEEKEDAGDGEEQEPIRAEENHAEEEEMKQEGEAVNSGEHTGEDTPAQEAASSERETSTDTSTVLQSPPPPPTRENTSDSLEEKPAAPLSINITSRSELERKSLDLHIDLEALGQGSKLTGLERPKTAHAFRLKSAKSSAVRVARPMTAFPGPMSRSLDDDRPWSASSYQRQRTEAWKSMTDVGTSTRPEPILEAPPPQRPSSPIAASKPSRHNPPYYKTAENWLAGGRDLYQERRRPKSSHVPGYLEGLSPRPASAAAALTFRRGKSPPPKSAPPSRDSQNGRLSRGSDMSDIPTLPDYPTQARLHHSSNVRQLGTPPFIRRGSSPADMTYR